MPTKRIEKFNTQLEAENHALKNLKMSKRGLICFKKGNRAVKLNCYYDTKSSQYYMFALDGFYFGCTWIGSPNKKNLEGG